MGCAPREPNRDVVQIELSDELGLLTKEIVAPNVIGAGVAQDGEFRSEVMARSLQEKGLGGGRHLQIRILLEETRNAPMLSFILLLVPSSRLAFVLRLA